MTFAPKTGQQANTVSIGTYSGAVNITQNGYAVAVGSYSGYTGQGQGSVALGFQSGQTNQSGGSVAIGLASGTITQGGNSVAIGSYAGWLSQGGNSVAIGANAGQYSQGSKSIAIGSMAGQTYQPANSIVINASGTAINGGTTGACYLAPVRNAIFSNVLYYDISNNEVSYGTAPAGGGGGSVASGTYWGDYLYWNNNTSAWAVGSSNVLHGRNAGQTNQGNYSVAIGYNSGQTNQSGGSVSVGVYSGTLTQGGNAVAIGSNAGYSSQGGNAVAIGNTSGQISQGANSIAIGAFAGQTNQPANSIIINATGAALNTTTGSSFYVSPVRGITFSNVMYYDSTNKEVGYGPSSAIAYLANSNTFTAPMTVNGNITSTGVVFGTNFYATSDRRLKGNVVMMENMLEKINLLKPVQYEWKRSGEKDFGFIAQDYYRVFPDLKPKDLRGEEPTDEQGNPKYYTMDYGKITCFLTKTVQELNDKIAALERRLENHGL